jgi:hypothetical protein
MTILAFNRSNTVYTKSGETCVCANWDKNMPYCAKGPLHHTECLARQSREFDGLTPQEAFNKRFPEPEGYEFQPPESNE